MHFDNICRCIDARELQDLLDKNISELAEIRALAFAKAMLYKGRDLELDVQRYLVSFHNQISMSVPSRNQVSKNSLQHFYF